MKKFIVCIVIIVFLFAKYCILATELDRYKRMIGIYQADEESNLDTIHEYSNMIEDFRILCKKNLLSGEFVDIIEKYK